MAQGIVEILADGLSVSPNAAVVDIVFVHGLGGNRVDTWQRSTETFWPQWLAAKFPNCRVFTFGFDSGKLAGFLTGEGASLHDLAGTLADALLSRESAAPHTLMICHTAGSLYWGIVPSVGRSDDETRETLPSRDLQARAEEVFSRLIPAAKFEKTSNRDVRDVARSVVVRSSDLSAHRRLALIGRYGRPPASG